MPAHRRQLAALAMLALVMALWAGNSIVGRAVRDEIAPLMLAFLRWLGAFALVLPFAWPMLRRDWAALRAGWRPVLVLGLTGVGAFNALLYSGLQHTGATNALLLQAAIPPLVLLLDWLLHGVRAARLQVMGMVLSMAGVAFIVFEGEPARALALAFGQGDVLILIAVLAWAFYTVWLRHRPAIAPASFVAATFAIGVAAMAPLALAEWLAGARTSWGPGVVGALAYVCVFPSILAYFLYNHAAAVLGAARAGQAITLMPLFGALLAALLLGERLAGHHLAGMAAILAGIALAALAARGHRTGAAPAAPLEDRA